jgi:hypothetical protein
MGGGQGVLADCFRSYVFLRQNKVANLPFYVPKKKSLFQMIWKKFFLLNSFSYVPIIFAIVFSGNSGKSPVVYEN